MSHTHCVAGSTFLFSSQTNHFQKKKMSGRLVSCWASLLEILEFLPAPGWFPFSATSLEPATLFSTSIHRQWLNCSVREWFIDEEIQKDLRLITPDHQVIELWLVVLNHSFQLSLWLRSGASQLCFTNVPLDGVRHVFETDGVLNKVHYYTLLKSLKRGHLKLWMIMIQLECDGQRQAVQGGISPTHWFGGRRHSNSDESCK